MTFALRIARETIKESFGSDPELAAGEVYELEKLVKAVIERCAIAADPGCDCDKFTESGDHSECKGARDSVRRIQALATEEES